MTEDKHYNPWEDSGEKSAWETQTQPNQATFDDVKPKVEKLDVDALRYRKVKKAFGIGLPAAIVFGLASRMLKEAISTLMDD